MKDGGYLRPALCVFNVVDHFAEDTDKSPRCVLLRLHGLGHLPNLLHDLCVAQKIVDEFCITGARQSLADGAVVRFGPGARGLRAVVVGHERLKVGAAKIRTTINNNGLRKPRVSPDAFA